MTSQELFAKAEDALVQGDLLQASEKGWGAAAQMVKGIAHSRGWSHSGHRELYQAVNLRALEVEDAEIRVLFSVASALHSNFYENWMPKEMVSDDLTQVRQLLLRLQQLA